MNVLRRRIGLSTHGFSRDVRAAVAVDMSATVLFSRSLVSARPQRF
jgi:hypothetical protein